jgi:hypothetical protein
MSLHSDICKELATEIHNQGFIVYLAHPDKRFEPTYGFYTDETGQRVVSFQVDCVYSYTGHYEPSQGSGSGWSMRAPMRCKDQLQKVLHARAPSWTGNENPEYTTLEQHLKRYGSSSRYKRFNPAEPDLHVTT